LILIIFADGIMRLVPVLIFKGSSGPNGQIYKKERGKYAPDVIVKFNETAYNNEELF
jgi:hypothetical protein